jgi:anti-sigma B factor antagonist
MQPQNSNGAHRIDAGEQAWFAVEHAHECVVVMASGELDLQTAPHLRDAVKVAGEFSHRIIVDLTRVTLLDSTSLAILVDARNHAPERDGTVALVGLSGNGHTAVNVTGLDKLFPIYAHVADAVADLTEPHTGAPGEP